LSDGPQAAVAALAFTDRAFIAAQVALHPRAVAGWGVG
jgi:hypothetical protein